uniref:Uncharacterized protein n=1 Tax=Cannabis sativa TaxID=3483 RepID=A0A803R675_CANSA
MYVHIKSHLLEILGNAFARIPTNKKQNLIFLVLFLRLKPSLTCLQFKLNFFVKLIFLVQACKLVCFFFFMLYGAPLFSSFFVPFILSTSEHHYSIARMITITNIYFLCNHSIL